MTLVMLTWLGLAAGSFVGAFTWRLHTGRNFVSDRSECEHCHHKLSALDLIPLFSWLALKGKCRYCKHAIGWQPLALEVGTAILFAGSYFFWPIELDTWQAVTSLVMWYIYAVGLMAMVVSDLRWMVLPDVIVFPLIGLGFVDAGLRYSLDPHATIAGFALREVAGALALGGIYWLVYVVTRGRGVGFGDVKLGLFIGIVLGWQQALLVLFLANTIGFVCVLPGLLSGSLNRKSRVPFGQFLIAGFVVAGLFGQKIIDWYTGLLAG